MATGTRTRLAPDERREQILSAAIRAFRRADYSAVSVDELADAAGVTRGLLHHYFGSKRALYLAVVERMVTIPDGTELVPPEAEGDLAAVLSLCVDRWLGLIEQVGGLWAGLEAGSGIARGDVDALVARARDDLVERMVQQVPFPDHLDGDHLRIALRAYSGFARVATEEWLVRGTLDRAATHAMLTAALLAVVDDVVPAMDGTGAAR
jgi:AcrR family transcriptional regulator